MKKQLLALTAITAIAAGAISANAVVNYTPGSGVIDSPHNMTLVLPNSDGVEDLSSHLGQNRVCAFCHTPHHALDTAVLFTDYAPLWSHEVSGEVATGYTSPTFDGIQAMGGDILMGPSRLCMSCHDGTIAIDQHYGSNFVGTDIRLDGDDFNDIDVAAMPSSLTNDHPIGFRYDQVAKGGTYQDMNGGIYYGIYPMDKVFTVTVSDSGLYNTATTPGNSMLINGATIDREISSLMYTPTGSAADGAYMTCASCHDVHNKEVQVGQRYLLVESNSQSEICLVCHNK